MRICRPTFKAISAYAYIAVVTKCIAADKVNTATPVCLSSHAVFKGFVWKFYKNRFGISIAPRCLFHLPFFLFFLILHVSMKEREGGGKEREGGEREREREKERERERECTLHS